MTTEVRRFEFVARQVGETDRAVQVSRAGATYWLPRSQVQVLDLDARTGECRVRLPDWLAGDRGWDCDEDAEVMSDGRAPSVSRDRRDPGALRVVDGDGGRRVQVRVEARGLHEGRVDGLGDLLPPRESAPSEVRGGVGRAATRDLRELCAGCRAVEPESSGAVDALGGHHHAGGHPEAHARGSRASRPAHDGYCSLYPGGEDPHKRKLTVIVGSKSAHKILAVTAWVRWLPDGPAVFIVPGLLSVDTVRAVLAGAYEAAAGEELGLGRADPSAESPRLYRKFLEDAELAAGLGIDLGPAHRRHLMRVSKDGKRGL